MLLLQMQFRLTHPWDGPGQMYRFCNANRSKLLLGKQSPQGERDTHFRGRQKVWTQIQAAPTRNSIILPAKHKRTTTQRHNLTKGRRGSLSTSWSLLRIPLLHYLKFQSLCNQVRLRQPKNGIINIIMRLFLAMSRPVCNTIFIYDYQIQKVLDWQQISKPKRNTSVTSQAQYKS